MGIDISEDEEHRLRSIAEKADGDAGFLARILLRVVIAAEREEDYRREQRELDG